MVTTGNQALNESINLNQVTNNRGLVANIYPNPAADQFILTVSKINGEPISIIVTDLYGNTVYQSSGRVSNKYVFGKNFSAGPYFMQLTQGRLTKTIKLIKSGK